MGRTVAVVRGYAVCDGRRDGAALRSIRLAVGLAREHLVVQGAAGATGLVAPRVGACQGTHIGSKKTGD